VSASKETGGAAPTKGAKVKGQDWESMATRTKVVTLTPLVEAVIPSLVIPTASKSTRAVSFQTGRLGFLLGVVLVLASLLVGWLLSGALGILGYVILFWLVGTGGVVMVLGSVKPLAFVKPICTRCRLLPVIVEHEAIHLTGVAREGDVWGSMRQRHSVESLRLEGDPQICPFCPIPKRLRGD